MQHNNKIKIIGAGNSGIAIVEKLLKSEKIPSENVEIIRCDVCFNTLSVYSVDDEYKEKIESMKSYRLENTFYHGLGTSGNREHGNVIFEENKKIIDSIVEGAEKIIVCGGLGGGFGSTFISNLAANNDKVNVYALWPLKVERERRHENARQALEKIKLAGRDYKLLKIDDIIAEYFEIFKESGRINMGMVCSKCNNLLADMILKDIDCYLS